MGADGHIIVVKRSDWDAACESVQPSDIGLYAGTILGTDAVWGYAGDNLYGCGHMEWNNFGDDFALTFEAKDDAEVERRRAALKWFDAHAEWHEVWT